MGCFRVFATFYDFLYRHDPGFVGAFGFFFGGGDIPDGIIPRRHASTGQRGQSASQNRYEIKKRFRIGN